MGNLGQTMIACAGRRFLLLAERGLSATETITFGLKQAVRLTPLIAQLLEGPFRRRVTLPNGVELVFLVCHMPVTSLPRATAHNLSERGAQTGPRPSMCVRGSS